MTTTMCVEHVEPGHIVIMEKGEWIYVKEAVHDGGTVTLVHSGGREIYRRGMIVCAL